MTQEDEQRSEDPALAEQEADAVEDLDVPEEQSPEAEADYSFKQAWPQKYDGEAGE